MCVGSVPAWPAGLADSWQLERRRFEEVDSKPGMFQIFRLVDLLQELPSLQVVSSLGRSGSS